MNWTKEKPNVDGWYWLATVGRDGKPRYPVVRKWGEFAVGIYDFYCGPIQVPNFEETINKEEDNGTDFA